jgi:uncharacterized surface protein with fasciclin (FAS1) repeats
MKKLQTISSLSAVLLLAGCASTAPDAAASSEPAAEEAPAAAAEAPTSTIVDIAVGNADFSTLVAALQAAELVDTLSGEGPFTVFAPTNDAFAKLPEGTVESLLADKEKLTAVLTYHVVSGKVMAADVVNLTEAATVGGANIAIDASNGVKINDATVVTADIAASNGVIHVIDTVLLPPG